jgi:hypothetical protein
MIVSPRWEGSTENVPPQMLIGCCDDCWYPVGLCVVPEFYPRQRKEVAIRILCRDCFTRRHLYSLETGSIFLAARKLLETDGLTCVEYLYSGRHRVKVWLVKEMENMWITGND